MGSLRDKYLFFCSIEIKLSLFRQASCRQEPASPEYPQDHLRRAEQYEQSGPDKRRLIAGMLLVKRMVYLLCNR